MKFRCLHSSSPKTNTFTFAYDVFGFLLRHTACSRPENIQVAQPRPTLPGLARPSPTSPCRRGWVQLGVAGCGWAKSYVCVLFFSSVERRENITRTPSTSEEHYRPDYSHGKHICSCCTHLCTRSAFSPCEARPFAMQ